MRPVRENCKNVTPRTKIFRFLAVGPRIPLTVDLLGTWTEDQNTMIDLLVKNEVKKSFGAV